MHHIIRTHFPGVMPDRAISPEKLPGHYVLKSKTWGYFCKKCFMADSSMEYMRTKPCLPTPVVDKEDSSGWVRSPTRREKMSQDTRIKKHSMLMQLQDQQQHLQHLLQLKLKQKQQQQKLEQERIPEQQKHAQIHEEKKQPKAEQKEQHPQQQKEQPEAEQNKQQPQQQKDQSKSEQNKQQLQQHQEQQELEKRKALHEAAVCKQGLGAQFILIHPSYNILYPTVFKTPCQGPELHRSFPNQPLPAGPCMDTWDTQPLLLSEMVVVVPPSAKSTEAAQAGGGKMYGAKDEAAELKETPAEAGLREATEAAPPLQKLPALADEAPAVKTEEEPEIQATEPHNKIEGPSEGPVCVDLKTWLSPKEQLELARANRKQLAEDKSKPAAKDNDAESVEQLQDTADEEESGEEESEEKPKRKRASAKAKAKAGKGKAAAKAKAKCKAKAKAKGKASAKAKGKGQKKEARDKSEDEEPLPSPKKRRSKAASSGEPVSVPKATKRKCPDEKPEADKGTKVDKGEAAGSRVSKLQKAMEASDLSEEERLKLEKRAKASRKSSAYHVAKMAAKKAGLSPKKQIEAAKKVSNLHNYRKCILNVMKAPNSQHPRLTAPPTDGFVSRPVDL